MGYLTDLIKSLSEDERKSFSRIELSGKEKSLRDDFLKAITASSAFDEAHLQVKHGFSKVHFDKTKTKLLDKTLLVLSEGDLKKEVQFLLRKGLYDFIIHRLKLQERKAKRQADSAALQQFYLFAFEMVKFFPFTDFPENLLEYYCAEFVKVLGDADWEQHYAVLAKKESLVIRYSFYKLDEAKREKAFKRLQSYQVAVESRGWYLAEVNIYLALSVHCGIAPSQEAYEYIFKAYDTAHKVYDRVDPYDKMFLSAMRGYMSYNLGRMEEAIRFYEETLEEFPNISKNLVHISSFIDALFSTHNMSRAKYIIDEHLMPNNYNDVKGKQIVIRTYAVYYMLNGEVGKAGEYIHQILAKLDKDFGFGDGVMFRFEHNVYVALCGDWEYAANLQKRNLSYIYSSTTPHPLSDFFRKTFLALGHIIRLQIDGKPLPEGYIEDAFGKDTKSHIYKDLLKLVGTQSR